MTKHHLKTRALYTPGEEERVPYENKTLSNQDLSGKNLAHQSFIGTSLIKCNLQSTNLSNTKFSNASFSNTEFQGAQFNQTTFSEFEPNHPLNTHKNSKHTNALFFNALNDIPDELNRLAQNPNNLPQATLQGMVAHSLVSKLATAPADEAIQKLLAYKDYAFFAGYRWADHYPSLVRGLVRGHEHKGLNDTKMTLCAYFLIQMPKLTANQTDLLYFFTASKDRKNALIQAISQNDTLKNQLEGRLENNKSALTQILNTRRHLFHTEREPKQTDSSKQLFGLFKKKSDSSLATSSDSQISLSKMQLKSND